MCSCRFDKIKIGCDLIILGDPGADSRGKGKSKRPSTPLSAPGSPRMLIYKPWYRSLLTSQLGLPVA